MWLFIHSAIRCVIRYSYIIHMPRTWHVFAHMTCHICSFPLHISKKLWRYMHTWLLAPFHKQIDDDSFGLVWFNYRFLGFSCWFELSVSDFRFLYLLLVRTIHFRLAVCIQSYFVILCLIWYSIFVIGPYDSLQTGCPHPAYFVILCLICYSVSLILLTILRSWLCMLFGFALLYGSAVCLYTLLGFVWLSFCSSLLFLWS